MEKIDWQVEGMTCGNCALTISKYLQKEGMEEVKVNPISGTVSFKKNGDVESRLISGIEDLGYKIAGKDAHGHSHDHGSAHGFLSDNRKRFLFCLPFTIVLMLHMLHGWLELHWLMNPWVQLALCLPVFFVGMYFFGRSAIKSLRNGIPNMDVLIVLGAVASFIYSLTGALLQLGDQYMFFETTASIITLVFMGNYLEEASVQSTQKAVKSLVRSQKVIANMIAFDDQHKEQVFPVENSALKVGDLILIKNGEQVPIDSKILWGECEVNEAIITGESTPVPKSKKDRLIGGSVLEQGVVKAQVTATGKDTVLAGILKMVEEAQGEKPPVQKLADKISSIFVPVVIVIAIATFIINYTALDISAGGSLMRSVAVLVIACPCAMGLATPAAIAVGLGRGAKTGILYRNASSLELFRSITQVVFDKTGTLTTGHFSIAGSSSKEDEILFRKIAYSLEKYSSHPLAKAIVAEWKTDDPVKWKKIEEIKGRGIVAEDMNGDKYEAGSYAILAKNPGHYITSTLRKMVLSWDGSI